MKSKDFKRQDEDETGRDGDKKDYEFQFYRRHFKSMTKMSKIMTSHDVYSVIISKAKNRVLAII